MHRVARLVLAALAAQAATGFIPPQRHQRHYSGSFQLGAALSSQTAARDLGVKIFDDESTVRKAYDEWRGEFGKGAFDSKRFEKFKQNFKMLTIANLEAINKAVAQGMDPPGWMYLNEFGDFSQAEYDALTVESNVDIYKIYEDWCNEFGVKADANRYEIFLGNYNSMKSYAQKTGKNLKLNKYADWTKTEAENGKKVEPKPVAQPQFMQPAKPEAAELNVDKNMKEFIQQRGTRILQYANGVSSVERTTTAPRATLAIGSATDGRTQPVLGTRRVQPAGGSQQHSSCANQSFQGTRRITAVSGMGRGTRVVQARAAATAANHPFQSTRAIQPVTPNQSFQGTRQIPPVNGMAQGTRAIQPANGQHPFQGTRVIQPAAPNGANQQFQGTRAIEAANPTGGSQSPQDTRQISSVSGDNAPTRGAPFQGTRRISDIPQQRPFRGTIPLNQPPKDT